MCISVIFEFNSFTIFFFFFSNLEPRHTIVKGKKMHFLYPLVAAILAPISLAAPATDISMHHESIWKRENLCSLKSPPALCQPSDNVTVEETAQRAYKFYRAFVVDGDPRTMFSLIDSSYIVCDTPVDLPMT